MSLRINTDKVRAALLADGWHAVVPGTFDTDAYEFMDGPTDDLIFGGGQDKTTIPSTGFRFDERDAELNAQTIFGPLTSILAVRYGPRSITWPTRRS
jgi:hypothetical protein